MAVVFEEPRRSVVSISRAFHYDPMRHEESVSEAELESESELESELD